MVAVAVAVEPAVMVVETRVAMPVVTLAAMRVGTAADKAKGQDRGTAKAMDMAKRPIMRAVVSTATGMATPARSTVAVPLPASSAS